MNNDLNKKLKELNGRVVKEVIFKEVDTDERITFKFTDGSKITIRSQDYESYESGLDIKVWK